VAVTAPVVPKAATTTRHRSLVTAAAMAFAIRLIVCAVDFREPDGGLDISYI